VNSTVDQIDEHFAKALGEQWLKIKTGGSKSPMSSPPDVSEKKDDDRKELCNGFSSNCPPTSPEVEDEKIKVDDDQEEEKETNMDETENNTSPPSSPSELVVHED